MRLILKYRCDETVNVRWGFTIWTSDQWVCITGDSWDVGRELAKGVGELSCTIARLPLMPGHYVVRLAMADSETTFAMFPESTYTLSIEVASPADTRTAYRRAYGQLVPLAAEWE